MTCDEAEDLLLDAALGDKTADTEAAERHAASCDTCGPLYAELVAARKVAVLPPLEPPPDLVDRVVQTALRDRDVRSSGSLWGAIDAWVSKLGAFAMRPQAAMAMLALIMVGSSLLLLRAKPGGPGSVRIREVGEPRAEEKAPGAAAAAAPAPAGSAAPVPTAAASAPADSGDAPKEDAAYGTALEDFKARRWAEAIRGFDIVAQGGGANASHAALYAARATRYSSGCGGAILRFESVSSRYAGTGTALEASWDAAVCYRELGQYEQAKLMFENLRNTGAYRERADREIAAIEARRSGDEQRAGAKAGGMASPKAAPAAPATRATSTK